MPGLRYGAAWRKRSPSGASILMTSAPMSPRIWVAYGPMPTAVRSTLRTPSRGPCMSLIVCRCDNVGMRLRLPLTALMLLGMWPGAARDGLDMTVDRLVEFLRSSIQLKYVDRQVAAYVAKVHLTQKLDDQVI